MKRMSFPHADIRKFHPGGDQGLITCIKESISDFFFYGGYFCLELKNDNTWKYP